MPIIRLSTLSEDWDIPITDAEKQEITHIREFRRFIGRWHTWKHGYQGPYSFFVKLFREDNQDVELWDTDDVPWDDLIRDAGEGAEYKDPVIIFMF